MLTLKPDPYPNPSHSNPIYPNKPTEPYKTVLSLTDTVGLQCAPSRRHTSFKIVASFWNLKDIRSIG